MPQKSIQNLENDTFTFNVEIGGKLITSNTRLVRDTQNQQVVGQLSKPLRNIVYAFSALQGQVLTKEQIRRIGWQGKKISNSAVVVAISDIRTLLGNSTITTVTNEGYIFLPEENRV